VGGREGSCWERERYPTEARVIMELRPQKPKVPRRLVKTDNPDKSRALSVI
jgi:hypothetical protein